MIFPLFALGKKTIKPKVFIRQKIHSGRKTQNFKLKLNKIIERRHYTCLEFCHKNLCNPRKIRNCFKKYLSNKT